MTEITRRCIAQRNSNRYKQGSNIKKICQLIAKFTIEQGMIDIMQRVLGKIATEKLRNCNQAINQVKNQNLLDTMQERQIALNKSTDWGPHRVYLQSQTVDVRNKEGRGRDLQDYHNLKTQQIHMKLERRRREKRDDTTQYRMVDTHKYIETPDEEIHLKFDREMDQELGRWYTETLEQMGIEVHQVIRPDREERKTHTRQNTIINNRNRNI